MIYLLTAFLFLILFFSFLLLRNWHYIKEFILLNIFISTSYSIIIYFFGDVFWGNDEIGIFRFFRIIIPALIQIIIIFIFSIYKSFKLKKDERKT